MDPLVSNYVSSKHTPMSSSRLAYKKVFEVFLPVNNTLMSYSTTRHAYRGF